VRHRGPIGAALGLYPGGFLLRITGGWLGGRATSQEIRAALAWSSVPVIASLILWVPLLILTGNDIFSGTTPHLEANPTLGLAFVAFGLGEFVLVIWPFVLVLKCVGEVHCFSAWRALAAFALVVLLVILIMGGSRWPSTWRCDERRMIRMPARRHMTRALAYTWAAPTTCVGLMAGALTLCTGGKVQRRRGALEFHGGFARRFAEARGFAAMTLGHVIIGRDPLCLDSCREHEQAHVRQVERWGPAFIPAYLAASGWAWIRGQHYYLDNWFERDARRACGEPW
jgi:hypothetical protein